MGKECLLSLCIPTNGVIEWVIPVLDSIYSSNCNLEEYEVIVTDNGNNTEFEKIMLKYKDEHENLTYKRTNAELFLNQIEAFSLARGELIKFINHRMILLPDAVDYLIKFAKIHLADKSVVFFSNGSLQLCPITHECMSFDEFIYTLSYLSSWSGGTSVWKKDYSQIDFNHNCNNLFPHTNIIFFNKSAHRYIVDDTKLMQEIPSDSTKKGHYNLFNAFALEFPSIIERLYKDKCISKETFEYVKKKNGDFVSSLYYQYIILKKPCSYQIKGYRNSFGMFYSEIEIVLKASKIAFSKMKSKIINKLAPTLRKN